MRQFKRIGTFFKSARKRNNLTQKELSIKGGVNVQFVSNWERGLCAPPAHIFQELIKILKIDRGQLIQVMLEDARAEIKAKVYPQKVS